MVNLITEHIDIWTAAQTPKVNGGRGRGNGSANQSPHGIKKLRELILGLAVRGKLVPQDSKDEPASVLLGKIAAEKARLAKEGKIKKQKTLPEIGEEERPFEVPKSWEWVRLSDLYYSISPSGKKLKTSEIMESGEFPVVDQGKSYIAGYTNDNSLCIKIPGPVIVFGDHTTERKYIDFDFVAGADGTKILRPYKMDERYFHTYLLSYKIESRGYSRYFKFLNDNFMAIPPIAEQHRIVAKVDELMALCNQLEQRQTDNNATHQTLVETLLATLTNTSDQGEFAEAWQCIANHFDSLFISEQSIDQLKQTILQLAVMGKLVPQDPTDLPAPVRASHADGPEFGKFFVYALECDDKSIYIGQTNDILKSWNKHATGKGADWTKKHPPIWLVHWEEYNFREEAIKREKELKTDFGRKWLKRELAAGRTRQAGEPASVLLERIAKEKARLIKEGKIKKQKALSEIGEDEKPFQAPTGWEWVRFNQLVNPEYPISYGVLVPGPNVENGVPFVRIADLDLVNPPPLPEKSIDIEIDKKYERTRILGGEILMGVVGSIGKLGVAPENWRGANIARAICRILPIHLICKQYLIWLLQSELMQNAFIGDTRTLAQPTLNIGLIRNALTPLPPLIEQHRIVAKIDELMTLCDTLKARLNDAQTTQIQLADVIVEQAVA